MVRYYYLLFLLSVCLTINLSEAVNADTFKRCCDLGTNWAKDKLNCAEFMPPIAGVVPEEQNLCLSTVKMCCTNTYRADQCIAGQDAAKAGKECETTSTKPGTENFKDCCEACKMGVLMGSAGGPCDSSSFGKSFMACCLEQLPSTTTSTTTTTTTEAPSTTITTTPAATTPITSPTSTESTTPETTTQTSSKTKNKLAPPPPPPLESLCDTLADEICAHICVPVPGSYRCDCRKGFTLMDDGKSCQQRDVSDRCRVNNPCDQQCFDTGVAVRCSCDRGYKLNEDKVTCSDIDECEQETHKCDPIQVCVNELGTYNCIDVIENEPNFEKDRCPFGYKYDFYTHVCDDLDECKLSLFKCPDGQVCQNTIGSYKCVEGDPNVEDDEEDDDDDDLECPPGYYFRSSILSCTDIDECATGEDDCNRESQICLNTQGGFTCQNKASRTMCPAGFKINLIGLCDDIDECHENTEICSDQEECINEQGGYRCIPRKKESEKSTTSKPENTLEPNSSTTTIKPNITFEQPPPLIPHYQPPKNQTSAQTPIQPYPSYQPVYPSQNQPGFSYRPYSPPVIAPIACTPGLVYSAVYQRCIDVNECEGDNHDCDSNQECQNTAGSYKCICKTGFRLDPITGACTDINECATDLHDCVHTQRCDNTIGSYQCVRFTSCGTGYTLNAASGLCEDDDECSLGTHQCGILGPHFQCRNTLGSFRCERKRCLTSNCFSHRTEYVEPVYTPPKLPTTFTQKNPLTTVQAKKCSTGYVLNSYGNCDDVNECDGSPCQKNQKCVNTNGSYRCFNLIECPRGYRLNDDGTFCEDIDECQAGTHKCTGQQQCINRGGSHICQCPPGHITTKQNQCEDINECDYFRGQQVCPRTAECENTIGSYRCKCKEGFRDSQNLKSCDDIDECKEMPGLCHQTCVNIWGSYRCACHPGYTLNEDNRTCSDIDECTVFKDKYLCAGICQNTPGSYTCRCPEGYRLGSDSRTCQDIDECSRGNICPDADDICSNIHGSYRCNPIRCPQNYVKDPEHKNRCKRATEYCNRGDLDCLRQPSTYSFNFITFVSRLPLPSDNQLDLFTMRGPVWDRTTVTFSMELVNVRCPLGLPKADKTFFRMRRLNMNTAVISLVKMIYGPQDVELQMTMEIYRNGEYKGSAVAKLFVIVSQYEF